METQAPGPPAQHPDDATAVARYCADGNGAVVVRNGRAADGNSSRRSHRSTPPWSETRSRRKPSPAYESWPAIPPAPRPAPCTPRASADDPPSASQQGEINPCSTARGDCRSRARNLEAAGATAEFVGFEHRRMDVPPATAARARSTSRAVTRASSHTRSTTTGSCSTSRLARAPAAEGRSKVTFELSGGAATFNWTKDDMLRPDRLGQRVLRRGTQTDRRCAVSS